MGIALDEDRHYLKWIGFVRDVFACLDLDTKVWMNLPSAGGYYDQDDWLMRVWETVRYEIFTAMNDIEFIETVKRIKHG